MNRDVILSIRNLSKRFGGTQALDDVSFDVVRGEIHALLGENGAGKSTLIKIVSGVLNRDAGTVVFDGEEIVIRNPQMARQAGINVVYQELSLVPELTVAENICASSDRMDTFKFMKRNELGEQAMNILNMLHINPKSQVKTLGIGAQQMVEIAGAIRRNCKLLILDEPTASLTKNETKEMYRMVRLLKEAGVTTIFISHKLSEVFDIADRATVLKDGRFVVTEEISNLTESKLVEYMTGRDISDMYPPKATSIGEELLAVDGLTGAGFKNVSFTLHEGEIVGFAGLTGAGRTEVCTSIFGVHRPYAGSIRLEGRDYVPRSVHAAMKAGFGYLPEDRKQVGIFNQMSIRDNTIAATVDEMSSGGLINAEKVKNESLNILSAMNTKYGSILDKILSLSGGNQQKVVLSRWLLSSPKILIVDEPTRGIDVGAKFEIYQLLRKLADDGMGIIFISSELPEIIGLSDTIITMYRGKVSAIISGTDPEIEHKVGNGIMGIDVDQEREEDAS